MDRRSRRDVPRVTLDDIGNLIADAFDGHSSLGVRVTAAMDYRFTPETAQVESDGLVFQLVLNEQRHRYVNTSLTGLATIGSIASTSRYLTAHSRHRPPPGSATCPFDDLGANELFVGTLIRGHAEYGILVNKQPWGYHHFMLVSTERRGQMITKRDLLTCFGVLRGTGGSDEATFSGVLAGASVLHFHFQIHRGAAAIWHNLEAGGVLCSSRRSDRGTSIGYVDRWPAEAVLITGSDDDDVAMKVSQLVKSFQRPEWSLPYNLGVRHDGAISVVVVPRSAPLEKPTGLNDFPDSWGRFSFNEMGGSIVLLSREGFESTKRKPHRIRDAMSQMSITTAQRTAVMRTFMSRL